MLRKRKNNLPESADMVPGTLQKNSAKKFSFQGASRSQKLIFPLLSIESLMRRQTALEVLSIGPRNEAELLSLYAFGFSPEKIHGLDIFSDSPWISIGDMHRMAFPNHQFDIIFIGWVLAYSKNIPAAVAEIVRVAKPHAYIAIGWDAYDLSKTSAKASVDTVPVSGSDEILAYFEPNVASVIFKGDLDKANDVTREQIVCIFRLK